MKDNINLNFITEDNNQISLNQDSIIGIEFVNENLTKIKINNNQNFIVRSPYNSVANLVKESVSKRNLIKG